ncbi:NAD(P)/FAD-dependent oxidoreductase [Desulfotomaculum copahuensis]|uniref:FAD dependent oxidoreductase domain-containing protein n=1 Tax=Desulfotomaculum copahuensis TaxID=1838280 RepID=A0A1B7LDV1_9FIRM|nr:FAD-dependent oxidoreductase [Desulfotomaculum copahuensis]OAT81277.1 hypothetical protein A6M21_00325 [Desulfotomaculum copahuensis]
MKVAVIGAGPAGLACALELERLGVRPVIYERQHRVGAPTETVALLLHLAYRPVPDQLAYLAEKCRLSVRPLAVLRAIHMHSCSRRTVVHGRKLGYLLARGRQPDSLERQLAAHLQLPVIFETAADALTLARHFDAVAVATGDSTVARSLGCWQEYTNTIIKGATVLGRFDPAAVHMYYDTRYSGHCYGFLAPFDRERASLHLCVGGIGKSDMDDHWELFLESEKLHYPVVETFDMEFHCGRVTRHRQGNLFLIGNSGSFVSNLLGLGLFPGLISGVLAARAIVYGLDYEALVRPLARHIDRMDDIRLALERLDNRGLDRLVGLFGLPGIKQLVYNSRFDVIRHAHNFLKELPGMKESFQYKYHSGGLPAGAAGTRRETGVPGAAAGATPDSAAIKDVFHTQSHRPPPAVTNNRPTATAAGAPRPETLPPPAAAAGGRTGIRRPDRPLKLIGTGNTGNNRLRPPAMSPFKHPAGLIVDKKPLPLDAISGRLIPAPDNTPGGAAE